MAELYDTGKRLKKENPEKFKLLCKVMEKTHGKCDNRLTEMLLKSDNVTEDDLVRLGGSFVDEQRASWGSCTTFWREPEKYGNKDERARRRENIRNEAAKNCREFKFKDSFLYRAMIKMGMKPDGNDGEWYESNRTYTTNPSKTGYGYGSGYPGEKLAETKYAEVTVMYMRAGEDLRKAIMDSSTLSRLWTEQARIRREVDHVYGDKEQALHPITSTNEEWRKFQSDHIIKEFGWLANMPEDVKNDMDAWMKASDEDKHHSYRQENMPPTLTNTILNAFRYPSEDKSQELVREAYQVMDYIGIGVCWNYVRKVETKDDGSKVTVYRDVYSNNKSTGVGAMLKKTSSMMRRFTADLRKGFSPEDVRELIVEDLNNWCETKIEGRWQFYVRPDAPSEYEGFTKKKKANGTKFFNAKSLELDENNPEDKGFFEVLNKLDNKE